MKLFELEIGNIRAFATAETLEEMEERKAEVDATFAFLPVVIREVTLEGYDIIVTPNGEESEEAKPRRGGRPKKEG